MANHLQINFDGQGVEALSTQGDWRFSMELTGVGSPRQINPVQKPQVFIENNRLTYDRGSLQEWYINDPKGLEQGFTLSKPLSKDQLVLQFALEGDVQSQLIEKGKALQLTTKSGKRLRYEGLKAWDANGEDLGATMSVTGNKLQLKVAVADAAYPITVDPWLVEDQKLTASTSSDRWFGSSVAISDNTAVVGAPAGSGAAYVFVYNGATWAEQGRLTALGENSFGESVGISGNTIVIGTKSDSAFVFVRDNGAWIQQSELTAADAVAFARFGRDVAISNNTIVVGAELADGVETQSGAAYVFERSGGNWSEPTKLIAGIQYDFFGGAVAISGDTLVVGAEQASDYTGAAYVFVRNGSIWEQQTKLEASVGVGAQFGIAVAISDSGNMAVIGAYADDDPVYLSGSAFVFERNGTDWTQSAKLTASDVMGEGYFGSSVATTDNTVLVGAYNKDDDAGTQAGSAYLFVRPAGGWVDTNEPAKLKASDSAESDQFGFAVAVSSDTALVGAYAVGGIIGTQLQAGAAYIIDLSCDMPFLLPNDEWRQISLPCNPGPNNTVEAVFGDDGLGVYDTDWVLFRYDTSTDNYIKPSATDTLSQNTGYWIVQKSGSEKTLNMPVGSIPTSITASAECIESSKGCYEIPLGTESNATQWNMIGYPFKTGGLLNNARVITESSDCETGCTLDIAKSKGI
ncbi:MAG: hypothetical protein KAG66_00660, partial [Methylococcales bacterium]|nr:hypothetical protein [Methylococcales bacterium]